MAVHILGIRHHGPGSARSVKAFLEKTKPDIVLVEGPQEADPILEWVTHTELKPPVAILCYQPDNPQQSCFYPFAAFSPEWQAISYARANNIHVRFMDLPAAHQFALEAGEKKGPEEQQEETIRNAAFRNNEVQEEHANIQYKDPISELAAAAGYPDGEKWWEHMFEHRLNNDSVFEAVMEMMQELRREFPRTDDRKEKLREAWMRKVIRQAEKEMFQQIVVICGAWHAPALAEMPSAKADNDLLKGLPKVKTECTWIPWTYSRLSVYSGYGAGIHSPGWYDHTWNHPADDGTLWMAGVAKLFREKQMDTSVAHVIEAVRLATSLASLRHLSKAGLDELNEATLSVLCNGEPVLMQLVREELIVSNRIGEVPSGIPKPPLQLDIEKTQKRLRLPATADWKDYTFDLRKENDLERSVFLHRLLLLGIKWGEPQASSGKGTFREQWRLQWDPAFSVDIIEKGSYGNTPEEAASGYIMEKAGKTTSLPAVCQLLESSIPAEIPRATAALIQQINNLAAASGDVIQLMQAVPGLVNITRYGSVRKTDADLVLEIVTGMITRVCISLPAACTGIDEEAAQQFPDLFFSINDAANVLQEESILQLWHQTLITVAGNKNSSPAVAGYASRLLTDHKLLSGDELVRVFYLAMSAVNPPAVAAAWLEGFLKGSGTILLLDPVLWTIVNNWVKDLDEATFTGVLPLLRRTFAAFSATERKKLGEKVKTGGENVVVKTETGFDTTRAKSGIPVVLQLLGIKNS